MGKALAGITIAIGLLVYFTFGTLSPCGMLRENVRRSEGLYRILPDIVVDAAIESQHGAMSPSRCIGLMFAGQRTPVSVSSAASLPQPSRSLQENARAPQDNAMSIAAAGKHAEAAIIECRAKRLSGELKTYAESALCANPRIMRAFNDAKYRHMDLIAEFTTKRLRIAEQVDQRQMTDAESQIANKKIFDQIVEIERQRDNR